MFAAKLADVRAGTEIEVPCACKILVFDPDDGKGRRLQALIRPAALRLSITTPVDSGAESEDDLGRPSVPAPE